MNILQLCPRFPFPLSDGGRIGMFNITKHLAKRGHAITMIAFAESDTGGEAEAELRRYCRLRVIRDDIKTNKKNFLRSILRNEPVYITRHRSRRFAAAMREELRTTAYDAVYGDHTAMFPYVIEAGRRANIPSAMRLHNVEHVIWRRYAQEERNPIVKFLATRQAQMLERMETGMAERVGVNFTITDVDTARMRSLAPRARVVTVLPGVDTERWEKLPRPAGACSALLVTTFSWIHNVNGALWFIERVMPMIKQRVPKFCLQLAGANPPRPLLRLANSDVRILGFVSDIRPLAAASAVYIAPLHVGSGIRIKILEAMAMGMPVVTTAVGCEGIGGENGTHYRVADTPEEFAHAVMEILADPERAARIGDAARAFIVEHFNWDHTAEKIEQELSGLLRTRPARNM